VVAPAQRRASKNGQRRRGRSVRRRERRDGDVTLSLSLSLSLESKDIARVGRKEVNGELKEADRAFSLAKRWRRVMIHTLDLNGLLVPSSS
jgi:hypothetical protein